MNNSYGFKITLLIKEINSIINSKITEELKSTGLTVPQITIIKLIAHHKELTVSEISEKMSLTKATVSGILDRLEKNNIIERIRSTNDKRVVYVRFSCEGLKLAEEIRNIVNNSFEGIFDNLTKEEMKVIYNDLEKLLNIIKENF